MKNNISKQTIFTFTELGANLDPNHIIFTVEKLVNNFLDCFRYLFHHPKSTGRPKEYKIDELLGFYTATILIGVNSCRKMADLLKNNDESLNYILNNKKPSKSTIAKFKNENELLISEFFYYIVNIGNELDLIGKEIIGIDGTVIGANTSTSNCASRKELKFLYKTLKNISQNEIDELKKYFKDPKNENITEYITKLLKKLNMPSLNLLKSAIKSKKIIKSTLKFLKEIKSFHSPNTDYKISLNDPEARYMPDKKGVNGYNYNLQVATDDKYNFIVYIGLNNARTIKNNSLT